MTVSQFLNQLALVGCLAIVITAWAQMLRLILIEWFKR